MRKEKKLWVEKKLRLEPDEAQQIENAAHAARLPVAVYIRKFIASGKLPKPVPPPTDELSYGSAVLGSTLNGLISNLEQIEQHCIRLGEPMSRLSGSGGAIELLRNEALRIGLLNKSREMSELEVKHILMKLQPASHHLNDNLAKPLNQGCLVSSGDWREVLETLQKALVNDFCEASTK